MIQKAEHNPISAALEPFRAGIIQVEAARRWGVDLSGMLIEDRKLLTLFGAMVMGTMKRPEAWQELDIQQKYSPFVDQWESFFDMWLRHEQSSVYSPLYKIGIDVINFRNPYQDFILDIFGLIYGPEVREMVCVFLWENSTSVYWINGEKFDLRTAYNFAIYFKDNFDSHTETFKERYERGHHGFDN